MLKYKQIFCSIFLLFLFLTTSNLHALYFQSLFVTALQSPDSVHVEHYSNSVAFIGDLDNDGYDEFIVGAPDANPSGRAYVYNGANYDTLYTLTSPFPGADGFGISVSGAGDVNNDNVPDIIVGSEYIYNEKAFVFSGATHDTLFTLTSPNAIIGGSFGKVVSGAGDVNNDGFDDVIVGAHEEFPGGINRGGMAYIFSGASGDTLFSLVSPDTQVSGRFGISVAGLGDINNDNFDDVIVGADGESLLGYSANGRAYVFSGATGDTLYVFHSPNPENYIRFGEHVDNAGDVNNDSINDIIVGSTTETVSGFNVAGRAYVFSGSNGQLLYTLTSPYPATYAYFGATVKGIGDINNDNFDDVFVGGFHESFDGIARSGRGYVFSGATGDTLFSVNPLYPETNGRFSWSAAGNGDLNNDGNVDIIVGAIGELGGYPNGNGRVYLFSASPLSAINTTHQKSLDNFVLSRNYPNPFNPGTKIEYTINQKSHVILNIYDLSGQKIKTLVNSLQNPGEYSVNFDGSKLSSGTYFYRILVSSENSNRMHHESTGKMLFLK